jgi:phosphatidylinositol-3-phosphatase
MATTPRAARTGPRAAWARWTASGGGRVGAVALSPFIKPGTTSRVDYNHYSLLKTVEKIFGLPLLGDARQPQVKAFGPDVFTS